MENTIHNMKLDEVITAPIGDNVFILGVPGGWIYYTVNLQENPNAISVNQMVFVPFEKEKV